MPHYNAPKNITTKISDKNRGIILAAAEKLFAENGFKGTSVRQIAESAGMPKTNVLYYFKTKQGLYHAVLSQILSVWNSRFDKATPEDDPALTLADYIREKMHISRKNPSASKVFAMEILNGGNNLSDTFLDEHRNWVNGRKAIIQQWIDQRKMKAVNPEYLLYHIWACTQHYADFSAQITNIKGSKMNKHDFDLATSELIHLILNGCGLVPPLTKSDHSNE
jgi:TetR/AcrR family transcriptional regulator